MQSVESQQDIEELQRKVAALESQANFVRNQMLQLFELIERQEKSIRAQGTSIARIDHIQNEMLSGRVWRTLRAAGNLAKRFFPSQGLSSGQDQHGPNRITIDEPKLSDRTPRSGFILVRGWCLSQTAIDFVRISVPGINPIEVQPSLARPDVKRAYPDLDRTGRSGFAIEIDTSQLANGRHLIKLELVSRGKVIREAYTGLTVDHERGYASEYDRWIQEVEKIDDSLLRFRLGSFERKPLFSIIMPVFNSRPDELKAAIQSVVDQSYSRWELCMADDGSTRPEIPEILKEAAASDSRIRVTFRPAQGGISAASNSAWQMATGDFFTFLDHDDTLSPNALAYVVEALEKNPEADFIYSDEDKLNSLGRRVLPFFKPDWSPDLLLSENYICHLLTLRRDLAEAVGGFRSEFDGSQDYDLILSATARAQSIVHIPRILYHWRAAEESTAFAMESKSYVVDSAKRALGSFCESQMPGVRVEEAGITGRWRVRYPIPPETRVSIIIASGGKDTILKNNIESIFKKTRFPNFEIVVIDNSKTNVIQELVNKLSSGPKPVRYLDHRNQPFNYSAINNRAARECENPLLLFLNDDTSVITEDWLDAMVEQISRPEVGAVGAKLLYPDGKIQHAGVVMGIFDNCGHAFKGLDGNMSHYYDFPDVIRNVSAVTGACLMTRREIFWKVGGFDEQDFAVAFNDVDLCLKIGAAGYRVIYTPHATLYHYEAFSKTSKDLIPHPEEVAKMRIKWDKVIQQDPYYNPHLTRNDEDYRIRT